MCAPIELIDRLNVTGGEPILLIQHYEKLLSQCVQDVFIGERKTRFKRRFYTFIGRLRFSFRPDMLVKCAVGEH